jgi:hypothetical protein
MNKNLEISITEKQIANLDKVGIKNNYQYSSLVEALLKAFTDQLSRQPKSTEFNKINVKVKISLSEIE